MRGLTSFPAPVRAVPLSVVAVLARELSAAIRSRDRPAVDAALARLGRLGLHLVTAETLAAGKG